MRARAMMRLVNTVTDAFVANNDAAMLAGTLHGSLFTQPVIPAQTNIKPAKHWHREKYLPKGKNGADGQ